MPIPKHDPVFGRVRHRTAKLPGPIPDRVVCLAIRACVGKRGLQGVFIYKDFRAELKPWGRSAVKDKLRDMIKLGWLDQVTEYAYEIQWITDTPTWRATEPA